MSVISSTRSAVSLSREEDITFKAAGIAFYAVTSLIPLLIVALAALSAVGAAGALEETLRSVLPPEVGGLVLDILAETESHGAAGAVGLAVTLWSATKIFRGLSTAFVEIYPGETNRSLVEELRKSLVVVAFLVFAVAVLSAVDIALAAVPFELPAPRLVGGAFAFLFLVVGLFPLYYVLPPRETGLGHALPGTVLAAVGWVFLQAGFSVYVDNAGNYAAYGLLGAVLLFVTFVYFAAIVLLGGAVVNAVLDR